MIFKVRLANCTGGSTISVQIVFTAILSVKKKTTCECMTQGREKLLHYLRKDFMCIEISLYLF